MPNYSSPSAPNMTIETSDESSQHFVRNDHNNHHPLQFSPTTDINLALRRLRAPNLHVPVNMTNDLREVGTHHPTSAERARGNVHSQVPPVAGPSAAIPQHHSTYIQPDEQIDRRHPTPYLTAARRLGFFPTLHLDELAADKKDCPVCTELFSLDDRPMLLDCNHLVGRACMERWVESGHNSCPMCREAIFRSVD